MPNGPLHREVARFVGVRDSRPVDRILDSTAQDHGPAHRRDHIHSASGALVALAVQGQLTPENVKAVGSHLLLDAGSDWLWKASGLRGPARWMVKEWFEAEAVRQLRGLR